MLITSAQEQKKAIFDAEDFLKTYSAEDKSAVKNRVVVLQDTLFLGKGEAMKTARLFRDGAAIDEIWRTATFPNTSAAYNIFGIEVDPDVSFGSTPSEHYAILKQFLRLSKLEIKRNDIVIHEFPLENLTNFALDEKVSTITEGGNTTTESTISRRTVKDVFNLNEYSLKVGAGERLDVTLKLDPSFTTSNTLFTKLYNLPSEASSKIDNGEGNVIPVRLHAVELTAVR